MAWQDVIDSLNSTGGLPGADQTSATRDPGTNSGQLTLHNPTTGETKVMPASNQHDIDVLVNQGFQPLNQQGTPYQTQQYLGGNMFYNPNTGTWSPLNGILGEALTPEQQAAMPGFLNQVSPPSGNPPPPQGGGPNRFGTANPYGLENQGELMPPGVPSINLAEPGAISTTFGSNVQDWFNGLTGATAGNISDQFKYQLPELQAAQMSTGMIPQSNAKQMGTSPELAQMLSGQGYDPATLALMRSRAVDDVSGAGRTEMAQAKRALEQAGIENSPASAAITGDVARRSGIEQSSALRDIDIANAQQGMQNKQFGIGQQTGIGLTNMQQANEMALANANRLFAGMSQNLANTQESNMAGFGAKANQLGEQAATTAGFLGNQAGMFGQAGLTKAANAETQNTQNTMNWQTQQANFERQRQIANQNAIEGRWHTAVTSMPGWTPVPGNNYAPAQGYNPFGG